MSVRQSVSNSHTIPTAIRLEPQLKQELTETCESMGISISGLMTLFAKAVVREQRIPFEIKADNSLDAYVKQNEKYMLKSLHQLENGEYYTVEAKDGELEKLLANI
jgi:DNA-damage-inducible protein J